MTELVQLISNNGLATVISAVALIMFWKLGARYVSSNESMVDTIKASETNRDARCQEHASAISTYGQVMQKQTDVMEQSVKNTEKLVEFHDVTLRQATINGYQNTRQIKQMLQDMCNGCRRIALEHFPEVSGHICDLCDEMDKTIAKHDSGIIK